MILLDTDVMIDLLRKHPPALGWFDSLGDDEEIVLPGYVAMELVQGSSNKAEQERLERELRSYTVTWPFPETCDEALFVLARYHLSHGLGMIDVLIGQTAVAMNLPLNTFNQKHYGAIPRLQTIQPYQKL